MDQIIGVVVVAVVIIATIIQEPFPRNTVSIESELFQYNHTTTGRDIVLK